MDYYKATAIISPFLSAILAGFCTYFITIKGKRLDLLYQQKIPAFKDLANVLVQFKNYCNGRIAFFEGNEYHPFYESEFAALSHRTNIAHSFEANQIFLSNTSKNQIQELLSKMSSICILETASSLTNHVDFPDPYNQLAAQANNCIDNLYIELNLK